MRERFAAARIPGSTNVPEAELSRRADDLPHERDAAIVMVCDVGKSSKRTTLFLKSMGYQNVRSLKGGIDEWMRKGLPVETRKEPAEPHGG